MKQAQLLVDLVVREWNVYSEAGWHRAEMLDIIGTPTILVNGRAVPNEWLEDEEKMLEILTGKPFIPETLEINNKVTLLYNSRRR